MYYSTQWHYLFFFCFFTGVPYKYMLFVFIATQHSKHFPLLGVFPEAPTALATRPRLLLTSFLPFHLISTSHHLRQYHPLAPSQLSFGCERRAHSAGSRIFFFYEKRRENNYGHK